MRILAIVLLMAFSGCQSLPKDKSVRARDFQKGLTFFSPALGGYSTHEADHSLKELSSTGVNWVSLVAVGYQETIASTSIEVSSMTVTNEGLIHAIKQAHSLGLKVMLKPHVDLIADAGTHWRGEIGKEFTKESQWQQWFSSYKKFINHYAELAQREGVDQFCAGTELTETASRESDWRSVVAEIRNRYKGPLVYAANHSGEEEKISWWDALDFIGVDAYYPLTTKNNPNLKELKEAWKPRLRLLKNLSVKWKKPILLTEVGYQSRDGTNKTPWFVQGSLDTQEQADAYRALLETFFRARYIHGIHFWAWSTNPAAGGVCDRSFSPYNKDAENVLRQWFGVRQKPPSQKIQCK